MAIDRLGPGLVPLPEQPLVAAPRNRLLLVGERRVPAPGVDAADLHALAGEIERRRAPHADAAGEVVVLAVAHAGGGVDQHDVAGTEVVTDPGKLRLDLGGGDHVPVGQVPEVELHPRPHAPLQRHLVDGDGALAPVHRRVVMPGRIHVGADMGGDLAIFRGRPGPVRQVLRFEPRHRRELGGAEGVVAVGDLRQQRRRVRGDAHLERHGQIDDTAGHGISFRREGGRAAGAGRGHRRRRGRPRHPGP